MTVLQENEGLITQIIGPVIDVEFSNGNLPEIYDALEIYSQDGQKTVAEALNISRSVYSQYESGERIPSISRLVSISRFFMTTLDYFIEDDSVQKEIIDITNFEYLNKQKIYAICEEEQRKRINIKLKL